MSLWEVLQHELKAIFSNPALLLTVFGGVLLYSFLYPLPYAKQVPREQKVVVVNLDNSQMSRTLERMVDATPQVQLVQRAYSMEEAEQLFIEEKLAGILMIPEHFYRDLLLGRQPTISYAGDASYFLVYGTVLEGMAGAGNTLAAEVKINRMLQSGQAMPLAQDQYSPIHLNLRSVFNTTNGYVNYVIPAIFVLILHHTLIMGAGILGGAQNEQQKNGISGYWQTAPPIKLLFARTLIFVMIYWFMCMYYFGFSFEFYSIPHQAKFEELNLLILPFLLATTQLGIFLGLILPRRELVTLLVLLSSMPLIFGAGFIWPVESIPTPITSVIQFVPVVPAMKMFLSLNQMGASFTNVLPQVTQMWWCVLIFTTLSTITIFIKRKYQFPNTP